MFETTKWYKHWKSATQILSRPTVPWKCQVTLRTKGWFYQTWTQYSVNLPELKVDRKVRTVTYQVLTENVEPIKKLILHILAGISYLAKNLNFLPKYTLLHIHIYIIYIINTQKTQNIKVIPCITHTGMWLHQPDKQAASQSLISTCLALR